MLKKTWFAAATVAMLAAGCVGDGDKKPPVETAAKATCPAPAQGARFSLCGTLTSGQLEGTTASGRRLLGSLEASPQIGGERYVIKGGTFNAFR